MCKYLFWYNLRTPHKKCVQLNPINWDLFIPYYVRYSWNHFLKRLLLKIMNLYDSPFFIWNVAIWKTIHFHVNVAISSSGNIRFLYALFTVSLLNHIIHWKSIILLIDAQTSYVMICHYSVIDKKVVSIWYDFFVSNEWMGYMGEFFETCFKFNYSSIRPN